MKLQTGAIAVLALVVFVVVGVDQGKQPGSKRPVESKGELERLREEHLEDAVPLMR